MIEVITIQFLDFWTSGLLDFWTSGLLDFWTSGFLDCGLVRHSNHKPRKTMQACTKRLNNERAQLAKTNDDTIYLNVPNIEKLRAWVAVIKGPPGSFYEGYEFDLDISVPDQYPMLPPQIKFSSKIFHPNVLFESGEICLDILKKEWSPAWSLHSACRAIVALLSDPAHDSPLNCDAGNMLRAGDLRGYKSMVTLYCKEHCRPAISIQNTHA